jgi:hypothetical protein
MSLSPVANLPPVSTTPAELWQNLLPVSLIPAAILLLSLQLVALRGY